MKFKKPIKIEMIHKQAVRIKVNNSLSYYGLYQLSNKNIMQKMPNQLNK